MSYEIQIEGHDLASKVVGITSDGLTESFDESSAPVIVSFDGSGNVAAFTVSTVEDTHTHDDKVNVSVLTDAVSPSHQFSGLNNSHFHNWNQVEFRPSEFPSGIQRLTWESSGASVSLPALSLWRFAIIRRTVTSTSSFVNLYLIDSQNSALQRVNSMYVAAGVLAAADSSYQGLFFS